MGNCCRIFVELPLEEVVTLVGQHPAVVRFGEQPIRPASQSYFGFDKTMPTQMKDVEKWTEINFINEISSVANLVKVSGYTQDLDGYGMDTWFTINS